MEILINQLIEHVSASVDRRIDRVLWINRDGQKLVCIDLATDDALPRAVDRAEVEADITSGELKLLEHDPYATLEILPADIKPMHISRRDKARKIIAAIVELPGDGAYTPGERGPMVEKVSAEMGISKRMVYWYLRKYWRGGQRWNALLPNYSNCGAPGKDRLAGESKLGRRRKLASAGVGINIGPQERKLFAMGIKTFYDNPKSPTKISLYRAYQETLRRFFNQDLELGPDGKSRPVMPPANELPTYRQFRYWFQKDGDLTRSLKAREGTHKFNQNHRGLGGDAASIAFGPGAVYQIDSTKGDVYLVSQFDRSKVIGRATIYLVVDVFSGMIAGFYAGLENPSFLAAALAIENAAKDKVGFCADYGIQITAEEWPCQNLPEALWADRGELIGKMADQLAAGLNIRVSNLPPYRPDLKPFVERAFRTTNDWLLHHLPGAVDPEHERGDQDYRLNAALTLVELQKAVVQFILFYNRSRIEGRLPREFMVTDNVEPRPNALWEWGKKNRSGHLRVIPPDVLRLQLLPGGEASVTEKGLYFKGLYYGCERLEKEQWKVRAREKGRWKVPVAYDPRVTDKIFLRVPGANTIEPCTLLEQNAFFNGASWDEVEFFNSIRGSQKERSRSADVQATANYGADLESFIGEAVQKTRAANSGESKHAKVSGIRTNRALERQRNNVALSAAAEPSDELVASAAPLANQDSETQKHYVPVPNNLELFKKQHEQLWNQAQ